jgi:hypothetical protein
VGNDGETDVHSSIHLHHRTHLGQCRLTLIGAAQNSGQCIRTVCECGAQGSLREEACYDDVEPREDIVKMVRATGTWEILTSRRLSETQR